MQTELLPNPGKQECIEADGVRYRRLPIRTHLATDKDDLCDLAERYAGPFLTEADDILVLSEKCVACAQGRVIPLEDIHPRKLAIRLSRHVTCSPRVIGLGMPETMEIALQELGTPRILFAAAVSAIGKKLFHKKDWFYKVAGPRARSIEGPLHSAIPPYNHYVINCVLNPDETAREISRRVGHAVCIVSAGDLCGRVVGVSDKQTDRDRIVRILRDNPLGQTYEQTPMGIIRRVK